MPLVRQYVASINVDLETRVVIDKYLDLVSKRASGTLLPLSCINYHYYS